MGIDRKKNSLVIAIRGTMNMQDSVTDANCMPFNMKGIDNDCMAHYGIAQSTLEIYNIIMNNENIIKFIRENNDYNIVVCGHSLGGGITVLLTLLLKRNNDLNSEHYSKGKLFEDRNIHGYAIASPGVLELNYAKKIENECSKYLTVVIYGKDIVPRLSWKGIMNIRGGIGKLLKNCNQSSWWIYEKSVIGNHNAIKYALHNNNKYTNKYGPPNYSAVNIEIKSDNNNNNDNNDADKEDTYGEDAYKLDIQNEYKQMMKVSIDQKISEDVLWNTEYSHSGTVFHICKIKQEIDRIKMHSNVNSKSDDSKTPLQNESNILMESKDNDRNIMNDDINEDDIGGCGNCLFKLCQQYCQNMVINAIKCRCCMPDEESQFIVYRANPHSFVDEILISSRMIPDHLPQVYLDISNKIHLNN